METMKKYIKNDNILNILKVKYRVKYGKINKIWQKFKHNLKVKYREKR